LRIKDYFEKAVLLYLRFHPSWAGYKGKKVLYARNPKTLRYIGLKRKNSNWLHNWILIYESHDPLGFSPTEIEGKNPFEVKANDKDSYPQQILEASRNFDAMICNTKALADDIQKWTKGEVTPNVINIASPLPRLENPPKITFGEKITIGYIGTIDQFRGVDILLESLKFLPENYMIRLVGRFRQEPNVDPNWLGKFRADASNKNRLEINILDHIADVKAEIDRCDILVQTASQEILDSRYATPQKSYGYMMRGKPIVVGNVPCHHEIFTEGVNAVFYNLNPKNLADTIINLVNDQSLANRIAIGAWFLSADYSFAHRASKIFHLVDSITKEEKNNKIR
jgi:glycosyltransferase involved in cell wall biosynthesis